VTVSEISLLGITAPFWGIVFGCLVAWLMDPNPEPVVVEETTDDESDRREAELVDAGRPDADLQDAALLEAREELDAGVHQRTRS